MTSVKDCIVVIEMDISKKKELVKALSGGKDLKDLARALPRWTIADVKTELKQLRSEGLVEVVNPASSNDKGEYIPGDDFYMLTKSSKDIEQELIRNAKQCEGKGTIRSDEVE